MDQIVVVLDAVGEVLMLRTPAALIGARSQAWTVAVGVSLLAGLSTMVGHAVIFVVNGIGGARMVIAMLLGAVALVLLRGGGAVTVAGVAWIASGGDGDLQLLVATYLLAVAPHVLGFLVFIPHLGLGIGRLLEVWTVLALAALLVGAAGVATWAALLLSAAVWLAMQLLGRFLARPYARMVSWGWSLATGRSTYLTSNDVLAGAPFVPLQRPVAKR